MQNHFITKEQVKDGKYIGKDISSGYDIIEIDKSISDIEFSNSIICNSFYSDANIKIDGYLSVTELFCQSIKAKRIEETRHRYKEQKIVIAGYKSELKIDIMGDFIIEAVDCEIETKDVVCKSIICRELKVNTINCTILQANRIEANRIKANSIFTRDKVNCEYVYCDLLLIKNSCLLNRNIPEEVLKYIK